MMEEVENSRSVSFAVATIVGSKNKTIHLRDFEDVDFNFTYFAHFKFAYFKLWCSILYIEKAFGISW